jgi:Putative zinc-finger
MPGEFKTRMQCAEFDALLTDVLDGKLTGQKLEDFEAHGRVCPACGPLLADAQAGHRWLKGLPEVEPPVNLVHNILAATTGREVSTAPAAPSRTWKEALGGWLRPVFGPVLAMARQPRFAMSFSMVFFSLSITMSLAGVNMSDIRHLDLRPSAVKHAYYTTTGKVVKYYENIRFVYEVESRVREFRRSVAPAEPAPAENEKKPKNNDTSGQPDQKQERNYSQGDDQPVLARLPGKPPVVTEPAHRRFS